MKENVTYDLKKWEIIEVFFIGLFGALWHFVYEWSGNNFLLGLISPVNESVFEHLKLLLVPALLFTLLEYRFLKKSKGCLLWRKWKSMAAGICLIIIFYYCYTGILQKDVAWLDIASFYAAVILNSFLAYRLLQKPCDENGKKLAGCLAWAGAVLLMILGTLYPLTDILPGLFLSPQK